MECSVGEQRCAVNVFDTNYAHRNRAENIFRDCMSSLFMPWSFNFKPNSEFEGRIECIYLESGAMARLSNSSVERSRSTVEIGNSPRECIYANFVISGEMAVGQGKVNSVARPGDLVLYDSMHPTVVRQKPSVGIVCLQLMFDKMLFDARFTDVSNTIIRRNRLICPLANTLRYLSDNLLILSPVEISALFNSLVVMIPVAISQAKNVAVQQLDFDSCSALMKKIAEYIHRNIRNSGLSPGTAAQALSISQRHLHNLFSEKGTTFSSYVVALRLEEIARLLRCAERCDLPVSALATEFGFRDLTTFNRTFRKRFGCTPRDYRSSFN